MVHEKIHSSLLFNSFYPEAHANFAAHRRSGQGFRKRFEILKTFLFSIPVKRPVNIFSIWLCSM